LKELKNLQEGQNLISSSISLPLRYILSVGEEGETISVLPGGCGDQENRRLPETGNENYTITFSAQCVEIFCDNFDLTSSIFTQTADKKLSLEPDP
jgi:hypothetical protein